MLVPREPGSIYGLHATVAADQHWPAMYGECPGTFRVEEDVPPRPTVATCDRCRMTVGVVQPGTPRRSFRHPSDAPDAEPRRRRAPRFEAERDPFLDAT